MAAAELTPDVVVIGAGVAGLRAATTLSRGGAHVLVLEARSRLGGRATAFNDRATGERVDNGQHVLLGCYRETLAFLDEIDASDRVREQPSLAVTMIDGDGVARPLTAAPLPPPLHLAVGLMSWRALGWSDRLAMMQLLRPIREAHALIAAGEPAVSIEETVDAWLIRHGQTPRLRQMLWEPLALAALNQPSAVAAATTFVRVLGEMLGGRDPRDAAIVVPARPLDEMYAEPARTAIAKMGGMVRTGARARIELLEREAPIVTVSEERWQPRAIVVAVPWFALSEIFTGATAPLAAVLRDAAATDASAMATVNLWFDRRVMNEPFVGLPGRTLQWVFDKQQAFGGAASHLSLVSSGAGDAVRWSNEQLIDTATRELRQALPLVAEARLLNATVIREPRATFSLAPGQPARPGVVTPVPGLFLAGDWIDTGLPATIEGAARSGRWAADAALAFLRT